LEKKSKKLRAISTNSTIPLYFFADFDLGVLKSAKATVKVVNRYSYCLKQQKSNKNRATTFLNEVCHKT
jgi:hypothetical protein